MCPIRIHWHVKTNYKDYWRVRVTITNFNYRMNYSQWNLVVQHPNFDNLTQSYSFNYEPLTPYLNISKKSSCWRVFLFEILLSSSIKDDVNYVKNLFSCLLDDTAMLWGIKFYNDLLMQAGPYGNVQSELLFRKDKSTFTFEKGWAFPHRIYFNGDNCVMPPPDTYPWLPNASARLNFSLLPVTLTLLLSLTFLYAHA